MSTIVTLILCFCVGGLIVKVLKKGIHIAVCIAVGMFILKLLASHSIH